MNATQKVKVIYIAGYGRSGTTLLSIALEQHKDVFGAGEIHELTRNAWRQNAFCSCGEPLQSCSFWSAVAKTWGKDDPAEFLEDYRRRQGRFESLHALAALPLLETAGDFSAFADETGRLFDIIASKSGKKVIVDSSKLPGRAASLARMASIDLFVVHLIRDGRGVAWSMMKAYKPDLKAGLQREIKPKSVYRTGLRWAMLNLGAERLKNIVGPQRYLRLRYEDFVRDPESALRRIGEMVEGLDLAPIGKAIHGGAAARPVHQIAGNRLRMNETIRLSMDEAWRADMPSKSRRDFSRLCGWLLQRYGYDA